MSGRRGRTTPPGVARSVLSGRWGMLPPVLVVAALALGGCTGSDEPVRTVQPGAPGETSRVLPDGPPEMTPSYTAADVEFMQGMIAHHAQALRMTSLVPERTDREEIVLIARRIEVGQQDEIDRMAAWLERRGEAVPDGDHHHHHAGGELMPGMLTEEQFAQLEAARGAQFDRLFLELMTYHHEGALTMVADLLAAGGAQDPEVFDIVSHIEADQRIEINRMRGMLASLE
ncbi:MAG: DUF305 domain-containing protein [Micromonosporaceae bacterium]|jgi:uncharacterized protein (DUF305 family)